MDYCFNQNIRNFNTWFQTGITDSYNSSLKKTKNKVALTVHGDGDGLGENEAILALKGGHLAELVQLQVLLREALGGLSVDKLDIESVLLCDSKKGCGAGVALCLSDAFLLQCNALLTG